MWAQSTDKLSQPHHNIAGAFFDVELGVYLQRSMVLKHWKTLVKRVGTVGWVMTGSAIIIALVLYRQENG